MNRNLHKHGQSTSETVDLRIKWVNKRPITRAQVKACKNQILM